jgi:hypothetical protein|nr:MAG TPA: hypothetical protein [Caudoviricetes sp.]DAU84128.1 MAG TPA: hypothetical protein [Caudoviricetes sp.]DAX16761.1 MAG TPA: hypothetical protein [Caudoviricetes sp.]
MCGRWIWVRFGWGWYHIWVQDAACGRVNRT